MDRILKQMKQVRAITFDAGGTLLYPFPSVGIIYSEVLKKHGVELNEAVLEAGFRTAWMAAHAHPRVGISEHSERDWWRNLVQRTLHQQPQPKDFDLFFDELWNTFAHPSRWRLYDQTLETLAELKKRGYMLALLSNWDERLRSIVKGLELANYFEHVFISSEVGFEKPDPRIFQNAEKSMQVSADQILHVGDSIHHDVKGAEAVGWKVIHLTHKPEAQREKNQIHKLSDLLQVLK